MDDPVPTVDFSPSGGIDFVYSFERSDVDGKLALSIPFSVQRDYTSGANP